MFAGLWPGVAAAACDDLLASLGAPAARRLVTADDLLLLRDIGQPDASLVNNRSPLAVSPEGDRIAFVLNRADPANNAYCRGVVVLDIAQPGSARLVDHGGELITEPVAIRGMVFPGGSPAVVTPVWSPDGQWLAYLRRDHGVTQVWRVRADGGDARMVSRSAGDVVSMRWDGATNRIVFTTRPGTKALNDAIEREGRGGWLYDARFAPNIASRPLPGEAPLVATSISPDGSDERAARAAADSVDAAGGWSLPYAVAADGRRAVVQRRGGGVAAPLELAITGADGARITCDFAACAGGLIGVWWEGNGRDLLFLRREGWAQEVTALYRWDPGEKAGPAALVRTRDVLLGCVMAAKGLACLRENATTPRYLDLIDLRSGSSRGLFDPNPQFARLILGSVRRLRWKNDRGLEAWGDLVLPPGYRGRARLPLVVVQYHSDGFLRGGTGDEYPIHAFAAAGFAVLSVERPQVLGAQRTDLKTTYDLAAYMQKDWGERRSLLSSLETGTKMAIATGAVDPARVGLTGLSDGASSVRFALINSDMFAAAAISTCCVEADTLTYGGIGVARDFARIGYPAPGNDSGDFWKPYALSLSAGRIRAPLLMQLADDEYLFGLPAFTALRAAGKAVEMVVFPGEHHMKWQPAHRAAIYRRNIDWFTFWLQNRSDDDPSKDEQYRRWEAMRAALAPPGQAVPDDASR
ncbi:Atxe2 family lasso peptide isopeptidase [Novosphingobium kaempferiae]|uniref:Atxe2 family lasso peptide isopeptidase n=1 Tax=Novosphingobium kaempferiae TaxID=2896849 RepID=UPI001E53652D|nr:Atxe2 family lasso peptide isopeptidase [Novosphingobium kaempferiae]